MAATAKPLEQADVELQIQDQESRAAAQTKNPAASSVIPATVDSVNVPRKTWKLFSAGFSFFVAGVNDGSMGALLPYMLKEYHIGTSFIAIL